jgi:hypothetical protein
LKEIWICKNDPTRDILINERLEDGSYHRYKKKDTTPYDKITKINEILEKLDLNIPIKVIDKIPSTI